MVRGAYATTGASGKIASASSNEVEISDGGTVGTGYNPHIYGGVAYSTSGNDITGTANFNKVSIKSAVGGDVYGGRVYLAGNNAIANSNTVDIYKTVSGDVYGGYALLTGGGSATASNNTVNIYGGGVKAGSAIRGAYVEVSGENKKATDNAVNLLASGLDLTGVSLFGYDTNYGDISHSGNTLNVCGKNITVGSIQNFDNVNFFLPADTASGDTMLTANTANLTNTELGAAAQAGLNLNVGDKVNLLTTTGALTTDSELKIAASVTSPASISTDNSYTFGIAKSGDNTIIATVTDKKISSSDDNGGSGNSTTLLERTKSLAETMAGSISMLNGGLDMTVNKSFDNAAAAVEAEQARGADGQMGATAVNGFTPFATIGGSNMRAKSGSYVDTKGWGIDVGFAREVKNKQGKLLFGPVVGYGRGNYDSYLDSGVHGSGKTRFWSLGLMAKQMNDDGLYYEGSIRGGKVKSDYYSGNFAVGMNASYDTSSSFFAAHLGVGKVFDLSHANKLDAYLKYYYTHQGSDRVAISSNIGPTQTFNFDSINSSRLRLGVRFIHALNERQDVYTGLAYQYEFDGDARATYNGKSTPSPSIKGSSGMMELGFRTKVSSNMDLDLSVNGWAGKQRGVNAQLGMQWKF